MKHLSDNKSVIIDRYSYSGVAYSISKEPNNDIFDWCMKMEEDLPSPDLIFCLTFDNLQKLTSRSGFGEERFETVDFQTKVAKAYERIATYFPKQWHWIECSNKSEDQLHSEILRIVKSKLAV
ncbi:hypothetical protein Ciccas_000498 [Cichlidogyrus casuarinus]|uniref:dTMP kinase n=1 Tax=Cichlidogyrus casuarinus TaxID=1844966 RepID=A0ABD2QMQ1_9PLAT